MADSKLESKHHYDIWQILKDLTSSQLRTLGCALGLSYSRLERMTQSDLPNEMIAAWLRREDDVPERSGQPTWNTLACKLKDIGQTGKSDDITQKWRQEHVSSANSSVQGDGRVGISYCQLSFACTELNDLNEEEKQELHQQLYSESIEIMFKFQDLFSKTTKSLKARDISGKVLAQNLNCLGSLKPIFDDVKQHPLRRQLPTMEDSEIDDAMDVVNDYCSFFNYHIVEHIINKFGTEQDKENLSKYKRAFNEYASNRHVFKCPTEVGKLTKHDVTMFITLDKSHDNSTVCALDLFVSKLREILKIPPGTGLKLCRVTPGSLKLTLQLPVFVIQDIFPLSTEQETELSKNGVSNLWFIYQFRGHKKQELSDDLEQGSIVDEDEIVEPDLDSSKNVHRDQYNFTGMITTNQKEGNHKDSYSVLSDSAVGTSIISTKESESQPFEENSAGNKCKAVTINDSLYFELHQATLQGEFDQVKLLVDKEHLDPLQRDEAGNTAVHLAAAGGHLNLLQYFIEDVDCAPGCLGKRGCTPLHIAAEHGHTDIVKYLVENQMQDLQFKDKERFTSLHKACQGGNLEVVCYLVDKLKESHNATQMVDIINEKTENGNIPLHYASLYGHLNIVKYLISKLQCNPNVQGWLGYTALHCAAEKGDLDISKYLIEEERCNPSHCTGGNKMTPLHIAAKFGQLNIVKYLSQEQNCNAKCMNSDGDTPLNIAAVNGHLEIVDFFISIMKCDPYTPGAKVKTPMHNAAQGGHLHIIKHLIEVQRCDPSRCFGEENVTPLHDAARAGELKIVKYLTQEKKCNPLSKRLDGETPLNEATYGGHLDIVDFFISELKCDPSTPGEKGRIPLHLAVQQGHMHLVKYLVEKQRCDPSYSKGEDRVTPLHVAAFFGRLDMAKYLTQDNLCDPLSKNARGETALNDAALKGAFEVVKYFISELKCNPNSAGEMGRVPIHLAAQGGHMDLVKYLTEECHCDTEPLDDDHMTPLHLASIFGHLDVVKYLVYDRHCNPTIQDSYAFTPLHYAARDGHIDVAKYFVATCKCPLDVKEYRGYTSLKVAEIQRHTHIVNYLKSFTSE